MYQSTELPNGIRVLTAKMPGKDSVALGFWAKVGGRFEPEKISGVSHYIEHLVFKGTKNYSMNAIKEQIEGKGGMLNAFTGEESTCYFTKILSPHFNTVYNVLSDMIVDPLFDKKEMEKERTVILEEIKMYLDMPSSHVQDLILEMLWDGQPLGRNVAGTNETVSKLDNDSLRKFHKDFYKPVNLLVSAAGDVDHEKIVEMTRKRFKGRVKSETVRCEPANSLQQTPKFQFVDKGTEQCHLVIGLHGIPKSHPDRYPLALLHVILGGNMSSRLFNEVREKRGLAYSIHTSASSYVDAGAFTVSIGVDPKKAPLAIRISLKELKKIAQKSVTASELRRAKDYFIGQLFLGLEDSLDHMLSTGERYLHQGKVLTRETIGKKVEQVTAKQVQKIAKQLFLTEHLNLAMIGPVSAKDKKEIKSFFAFENC